MGINVLVGLINVLSRLFLLAYNVYFCNVYYDTPLYPISILYM